MLIDTYSTHNFLEPSIATKANLLMQASCKIEVRVANREKIRSIGEAEGVEFLV